jgi:AMP deaminase
LAAWICDNKLFSENVRWLIQIPRLYSDFKGNNMIQNMGEAIDSTTHTYSLLYLPHLLDIFAPLFEVSVDPSSHPNLHRFLQQVVGFDCVDDESKLDKKFLEK